MIRVRFTRDHKSYKRGECLSLSPRLARFIIKSGRGEAVEATATRKATRRAVHPNRTGGQ